MLKRRWRRQIDLDRSFTRFRAPTNGSGVSFIIHIWSKISSSNSNIWFIHSICHMCKFIDSDFAPILEFLRLAISNGALKICLKSMRNKKIAVWHSARCKYRLKIVLQENRSNLFFFLCILDELLKIVCKKIDRIFFLSLYSRLKIVLHELGCLAICKIVYCQCLKIFENCIV